MIIVLFMLNYTIIVIFEMYLSNCMNEGAERSHPITSPQHWLQMFDKPYGKTICGISLISVKLF